MSHRVTTQTEIKDKALAIEAIKAAGFTYAEDNDRLHITSGSMQNATIDLRTGIVSGDTDHRHTKEKLGALRKHYTEAKFRAECLKQGISIESRRVDEHGNIRLMCQAHFA